jgi:acyl carrier protein
VPGIEDALVAGREMDPGAQSLIAYVVASPGLSVPGSRIRQHLARVLPDYMIPSFFVELDAIPLTPNGKADRLSLPLPSRVRRKVEVPFKAPGTAIEFELEAIWADVLGVEQVGIDDPFLYLGGDSLKAMDIIFRVSDRFGVDVPVSMMLGPVTIADMASVVAEVQSSPAPPG